MIAILRDNPLLLLFVVAGIGYPLGRIKVAGGSLGVAAVLFVGLAVGGLDPNLKLPEIIYQMGLVLFVYCIGLSSGVGFFTSFRGKGLRDNLFAVTMVLFGAVLTLGAHWLFGLEPLLSAGLFTGSLTSTPALAALVEYLKHAAGAQPHVDPVIGYSIAYPVSVLGMITTLYLVQRWWRIDYAAEARSVRGMALANEPLSTCTVRVSGKDVVGQEVGRLVRANHWNVLFGRVKRGDRTFVTSTNTRLEPGDLVTVVGTEEELERVVPRLGEQDAQQVDMDRTEVDYRRIFVSNPKLAGKALRELNLPQRFEAVVTRVRRGDMELLPHGDTVLQLGDRVRVVTRRENLPAVTKFFGDSYRALSEIDVLSFSLGLALGLLLGMVPIPLPGGITIKLGSAGGPLIMALVLGAVSQTGPIVWTLPYNANQLLRQIGLIFFLAGIGTRSGYAFFQSLHGGQGLSLLIASAVISCVVAFVSLWVGYKKLKIPFGILAGQLAGIQTQSATLGFALEQAGNDLPNVGYALIYPMAMVVKIVITQVMAVLLR